MVAITALNGRIPTSMLVAVQGHLLRADAAASLVRLSAAMEAAGYGPLLLSEGLSAYRSLDDQQYMISIGLTTMRAGQSQHGEAVAGDFQGLGGYAAKRYAWLVKNGPTYGWSQPAWARADGVLPEPWHWEYNPDRDTHPTAPLPEDDMLTEADRLILRKDMLEQAEKAVANHVADIVARTTAALLGADVGAGTLAEAVRDGRIISRRTEEAVLALDPAASPAIDYAALAAALVAHIKP